MPYSCEICGKGAMVGNTVSHSNNRAKRQTFPNLQKQKVIRNGRVQRITICTRCIRSNAVQKAA